MFGAFPLAGTPRLASAAPTTIDWEGHLDLVEVNHPEKANTNFFNFGENPFHAVRLRLLATAKVHEHVDAFAELLSDDAKSPRVFGGFVRLSDPKGRDVHLEVGKIPLHLGAYPNRSYASKNNLIGSPLAFQYHTDVRDDQVPTRGEDIVANQTRGYYTNYSGGTLTGVGYPGTGGAMTILYDNCWDFGAVVIGTAAPFEFAFGATNGTVGMFQATDDNDGKQVLGRLGFVPAPWMRVGVSGSRGPYLNRVLADELKPGQKVEDFNQVLGAADLELSYDRAVFYSEYVWNRYQQPYIDNLDLASWYFEGKVTVLPGWYVAGRYSRLEFDEIALSGGGVARWDAPLWRNEFGVGFKPSKQLLAKLVYQETHVETTPRRVDALLATQLSLVF